MKNSSVLQCKDGWIIIELSKHERDWRFPMCGAIIADIGLSTWDSAMDASKFRLFAEGSTYSERSIIPLLVANSLRKTRLGHGQFEDILREQLQKLDEFEVACDVSKAINGAFYCFPCGLADDEESVRTLVKTCANILNVDCQTAQQMAMLVHMIKTAPHQKPLVADYLMLCEDACDPVLIRAAELFAESLIDGYEKMIHWVLRKSEDKDVVALCAIMGVVFGCAEMQVDRSNRVDWEDELDILINKALEFLPDDAKDLAYLLNAGMNNNKEL